MDFSFSFLAFFLFCTTFSSIIFTLVKDYVDQQGEPAISRKSYHECAICGETLLFIRQQLLTHVKTRHNMTISDYNKAHMTLRDVQYMGGTIMDKGRKTGTQKAPQWCDGSMFKCPYCFTIYYRYFTFRIHLIKRYLYPYIIHQNYLFTQKHIIEGQTEIL